MHIGVPAEVKNHEYRVALTPAGAHALVQAGHSVVVQSGAGEAAGHHDDDYRHAGATLTEGSAEDGAAEAWAQELVLKVKEPVATEYQYLREDQVLFTYLHLAADRPLTERLIEAGTTAIAYETVQAADGSLPLLTPMSEVAGRFAALEGASHLRAPAGGSGVLLPGVPGAPAGRVLVIGGGIAGENAAAVALGMGAEVTIVDVSLPRLRQLDTRFGGRVRTLYSTSYEIAEQVRRADLVIGAVLIPGAAAPKLVTDEMVASARPGTVFVDIAVDQGGCFASTRATTHDEPTFKVGDAVFYCVANMPGAVPSTSTAALTNATLPYVLKLANQGWVQALENDPALAHGLSTTAGRLRNHAVAAAHDLAA